MIMPEKYKRSLILEVFALLHVHSELQEKVIKVTGSKLLAEGITHTQNGKVIEPGIYYMVPRQVNAKINHGRRLRALIDEAKDNDEMTTKVAEYLVKYGKPEINNKSNP